MNSSCISEFYRIPTEGSNRKLAILNPKPTPTPPAPAKRTGGFSP